MLWGVPFDIKGGLAARSEAARMFAHTRFGTRETAALCGRDARVCEAATPYGPARAYSSRVIRAALSIGVALCAVLLSSPAWAINPFEIQVYDGTANAPGVFGLELHVNYVANGLTTATSPELPQNHQTHFTLEPSYGLTPWWEIGGYFQTALRADGTFDYAGVKLRSKWVTPPQMERALDARDQLGAVVSPGALRPRPVGHASCGPSPGGAAAASISS